MTKIAEPKILSVAVGLYLGAVVWAVIQGPGSFLSGMLSGCGSIAMGVWMGLVISHQRGYTPENLMADEDPEDY